MNHKSHRPLGPSVGFVGRCVGGGCVSLGFESKNRRISASSSARTFASMYFPGLKVTTCLRGTSTCSPVRGFRAFRAARGFTSNTPKFRSSIRWSRTKDSIIASKVLWTTSFVCCCVSPTSSEIVLTMSFLVTLTPLKHGTAATEIDVNPLPLLT